MHVMLVTGGARSGKSRFAQNRALDLGGNAVTCIATGVATDAEMEARIAHHREDRPAPWGTLEAPYDAAAAITEAPTDVVLLDCLTFLVSNTILLYAERGEDAALKAAEGAVGALLDAAAARAGHLIVVTNEVGWGVVPAHALGRWFRDAAGRANQRVAAAAAEVWLLIAGMPMRVAPP